MSDELRERVIRVVRECFLSKQGQDLGRADTSFSDRLRLLDEIADYAADEILTMLQGEPVAWTTKNDLKRMTEDLGMTVWPTAADPENEVPLYLHPPVPREVVGYAWWTDEDPTIRVGRNDPRPTANHAFHVRPLTYAQEESDEDRG